MNQAPIIVPLDFSQTADKALDAAITIAKLHQMSLLLVHVVHVPLIDAVGPLGYSADAHQALFKGAQEAMDKRVALVKQHQIEVEGRILDGFVADTLEEQVNESHAQLLVMGTTGASGILERLIGSNATHLLHRVKIPMLFIPEKSGPFSPKHVLFATQLERDDRMPLAHALGLLVPFNADVELLHVNANLQLDLQANTPLLEALKSEFPQTNLELREITADSASEGLELFLLDNPVDLLVMVPQRKSWLDRLFEGSTTRNLAMQARVPMLMVPEDMNN